jgi:hypothetical protein
MTLLLLHWPKSVLSIKVDGQVITGGWLSLTMISKVQLAVFPSASVAVQRTVLVPLSKVEPLDGVQVTVTPGQLSLAVTV